MKYAVLIFLVCVGLAGLLYLHNAPLATVDNPSSSIKPASNQNAFDESFGFFDYITNEQWAQKKAWVKRLPQSQPSESQPLVDPGNVVRVFYTNNWNPDFSCLFKSLVGPVGDGHKWVCDPHRLQAVNDCLIYSVGSNGQFEFEKDFLTIAPNCEIHIFDPDDYSPSMKAQNISANYHVWGLTSSDKFQISLKEGTPRDAIKFKDMNETMRLLGHENRTIHVFKIDCEGCERESYMDWLQVDIRQVQVETHGWDNQTLAFFEDMRKAGYVMFSKEANVLAMGTCYEFSFLKLKKSFFE